MTFAKYGTQNRDFLVRRLFARASDCDGVQRSIDFVHSTDEVRRLRSTALKIVIFLSDVYLHVLSTATKFSVHLTLYIYRRSTTFAKYGIQNRDFLVRRLFARAADCDGVQRSIDFVHSTDEVRRLRSTALKIVIFLYDVYLHVLPTATKCSVHSTNEVRRSQSEEVKRKH
ncbi:hypothetical protein TcasGA2_TC000157 [Tribolium castaneum]|uniref:Uncharacterized protein n=1 Tax=Tribolium castaneum TaxID=7070 RepID=D7GYD7_TRICA|nr:hypothetical protein TcasGA2_TC000157 [Tribolium castaneum]